MNMICTDKAALDKTAAERQMRRWYKDKLAKYGELHYRRAKPKIICEKFLGGANGALPEDYKIYCINGNPVFMLICLEREKGLKRIFVNKSFELLDINDDYKSVEKLPEKPGHFDEMFATAAAVSKPFPLVRVDFYEVEGRLYIGELTFTPQGGYLTYKQEWLNKLGDMLRLPEKNRGGAG